MEKNIKTLMLFLLVLVTFNCSKTYVSVDQEVGETLVKVKNLMQEQKYRRVIEILSPKINKFSGVPGVDSLVFYLGASYIETEDFESGIVQLRRFVDNFRTSPLRPTAQYYLAQAYVRRLPIATREQKITKMALRELNFFTELYPDHKLMTEVKKDIKLCRNLLAQYVFEIGYFYFRKEEFSPARAYFSDVVSDYIDTDFADDGRLMLAYSYVELTDYESAKAEFELVDVRKVTEKFKEHYDDVKKELQ